MGSGIMQYRVNGKVGLDDKIKNWCHLIEVVAPGQAEIEKCLQDFIKS